MSFGLRDDPPRVTPGGTRWWSPRTWSLRARLVGTQVALLAVVCASIGLATEFALQRFLMHQLDEQLSEAARRSAAIFELPPPPPGFPPPILIGPGPQGIGPPGRHLRLFDPEQGPGPGFLNAPGQAAHTVGAVVSPDGSVDAGVIAADGSRHEVSAAAAGQLSAVPASRQARTVDLDGLGRYRVIGLHPRHGGPQIIVTGLPTAVVDDTLLWVFGMFCVIAAIALIAAITAGTLLIRRQFAPLAEVSAAAREVADLELERGEVRLPTPIVPVDPAVAHTEVGQLGTSLNRMLDRIASALSARHASETRVRQFVADASHELRTPLAAIRGYTELAQRKRRDLPDDVAHAMSRVESETTRMTQLVEDMLLLARLDAGRPLERERVDLSRLVVDTVSDAHVAGPQHEWSLDLAEDPVVIDGDEARLHQVMANLLANARTHTPPGTSVTVALTADAEGWATVTVTDDGPGIAPELLPDVFERFARGDSSRSRREGSTGLGLAIVAAVVKAHGGTIDVTSEPGATRFVVRLPGAAHS
ncbi:HAMP domain-containing histidine kinase [Mycolicibacterium goodii]|uniref:histidine kinase n=1 Tax=Mycolicibacterium goodii TaxID=134601 RepID=A0ABS6HXP4_MYCGD|nr:HAMP domain-containing sensor histidine kinase [Mycolicibacterium goodii]MBU8819462.1 HAMP domain-containing histidine kinase [Mycolicibacterium goodii]MBU8826103.1 HAMP domain-containing histidine kinase [Mycolicibacterium goodii]MBU8831993.1 HAMP domain-containing histidine kinase [Mycolicibacterium goodii]MBU8839373.1 HAMP domain-containing histidine kinase [Mycolicibacterium goodii]ULN46156.1 HAMP domain-containing histidine kinase [Mycolicibacterium goodii]